MYEGERCIIFDESGNLGRVGRYFVIACIDTTECKALHNVMKRKLKIADDKFPDMKKNHAHEIKAVDAYPCVKHHILECIASKNLSVSYIVADLQHVKPKLLEDKNILYNYLMKLLLDRIISSKDNGTSSMTRSQLIKKGAKIQRHCSCHFEKSKFMRFLLLQTGAFLSVCSGFCNAVC